MEWCDYNCEHAQFPDEALEGACRTVAGVWCKKLGRLIPKNSPCQADKKGWARRRKEARDCTDSR
jgi:hypothetical protein